MSADNTPDNEDSAHPYETEDSFHPMGEEWEDRMRDQLEETDYDADLGMEMARDAQRLVAGEITEEEFYAEYHEDVDEEFDTDARPVFDDIDEVDFDDVGTDESVLKSLAEIDLEGDEASRRDLMKKMGAGAAFLGYGAYASYEQDSEVPQDISGINPASKEEREHRWGMVIDLERCDGCLACVTGCVDENGTSTGANWMYVFPYQNEQTEQENFLVRPCQHCSNAPCAKVCPVRARHVRQKDGLVLTDYETCIGCRYCQVACPYGVNYFQWGEPDVPMEEYPHMEELDDGRKATPTNLRSLDQDERDRQLTEAHDHVYDTRGKWVDGRPPQGVMGKCTFCPTRQDGHSDRPQGTTACQDACDDQGMSAIHFGDLDDPESRPNQYIRRRSENANDREKNDVIHFDENPSFQLDVSGVDDGFHPLHLVERDAEEGGDWLHLDSDGVVVTSADPVEESENFGASSIGNIGDLTGQETDILYTDAESVPVEVVFADDEFEEGSERTVTASLRLVGAGGATDIGEADVTLSESDAEGFSIPADADIGVDSIDVPDDVYVLELLVEGGSAAQKRVYVSEDRPNVDRPDPSYSESQLDGELDEVPTVVFAGESTTITATIQYPANPVNWEDYVREMELQVGNDDPASIANTDVTFTEQNTSNTPWGGKQSSFKLLENLGTEPNVTYLGNEPRPGDEQVEGPVAYEQISDSSEWSEFMTIESERKHHLDYNTAFSGKSEGEAD